jgi:hypothetical protein
VRETRISAEGVPSPEPDHRPEAPLLHQRM